MLEVSDEELLESEDMNLNTMHYRILDEEQAHRDYVTGRFTGATLTILPPCFQGRAVPESQNTVEKERLDQG